MRICVVVELEVSYLIVFVTVFHFDCPQVQIERTPCYEADR
jgi:hypothetical protein